jgi:pyridoxamine 5'-phosphate oxidase
LAPEDLSELTKRLEAIRGARNVIGLDRDDLAEDPYLQFARWMEEAMEAQPGLANAITLATADAQGIPSARTVLLKGVDRDGFVFFTNHKSRKGRDLAVNPHAALCLYWPHLHRQVNVAGPVSATSEAESDDYFRTRPVPSRIASIVSQQSTVLESRDDLERRFAEMEQRYATEEPPRPPHWGGFRLTPVTIEFWQGRDNRLHDRFQYERASGGGWTINRLSP